MMMRRRRGRRTRIRFIRMMMMMMLVIQLRPVVGSIIQRSPVTIIQQGGSKANHQTFSNDEVDEAEASL